MADLLDRHAQGTAPQLDAATVHSFSGRAAAERLVAVFDSVISGAPLPGELAPAGAAPEPARTEVTAS